LALCTATHTQLTRLPIDSRVCQPQKLQRSQRSCTTQHLCFIVINTLEQGTQKSISQDVVDILQTPASAAIAGAAASTATAAAAAAASSTATTPSKNKRKSEELEEQEGVKTAAATPADQDQKAEQPGNAAETVELELCSLVQVLSSIS
jgi:hypothetical protein